MAKKKIEDIASDAPVAGAETQAPTELEELQKLYADMQKWGITRISQLEAWLADLQK